MALPANAKVEAAPNFLANLNAAHQFFLLQDATTAETRFSKLKTELREMIAILAWSPASGRPARFLTTQAAQTRLKACRRRATGGTSRTAGAARIRHRPVPGALRTLGHRGGATGPETPTRIDLFGRGVNSRKQAWPEPPCRQDAEDNTAAIGNEAQPCFPRSTSPKPGFSPVDRGCAKVKATPRSPLPATAGRAHGPALAPAWSEPAGAS